MLIAVVLALLSFATFSFGQPGLPAPQPAHKPTFYKDVLPILQDHCQSCHRPGEIAPMSLVTYHETKRWAASIKLAVESKSMPPWFADPRYGKFTNDPSLTPQQISKLRAEAHETTTDMLLVYAPGSEPDRWPDGMAKSVPVGSDLVFQMHYTANGTAGKDQTSVGMVFSNQPPK